jgi:hypothetical protein
MGHVMFRNMLIGAFALLLAAAGGVAAVQVWDWTTNRVTLRNNANRDLVDVELLIDDADGRRLLRRAVTSLAPGGTTAFYFVHADPFSTLRFTLDGQTIERKEVMDLWRGEDWILSIADDGEVTSGYDH